MQLCFWKRWLHQSLILAACCGSTRGDAALWRVQATSLVDGEIPAKKEEYTENQTTIEPSTNEEEDPILQEWDGFSLFFGCKIPGEHYVLFKNRIRIESGVMFKTISETQYKNIDRTSISIPFWGSVFHVGDVILSTKMMKNADPVLHVKNPEAVMAAINQACYDEHQAYVRSRNRSQRNGYQHDFSSRNNSNRGRNKRRRGEDDIDEYNRRRNVAP